MLDADIVIAKLNKHSKFLKTPEEISLTATISANGNKKKKRKRKQLKETAFLRNVKKNPE